MALFEELINRTITRLSMVPGTTGVQVYAEAQIGEMIQHKFDTMRLYAFWDDMMDETTITLDAAGIPIDDIQREPPVPVIGTEIYINSYGDIQFVWDSRGGPPIPASPRRTNPNRTLYGKRVAPHANKVFKVTGCAENEQVQIRWRKWWPAFMEGDTVPFDDHALILGACWDYLEDDGANPMQAEKFKMLYTERVELLTSRENDEAIKIGDL